MDFIDIIEKKRDKQILDRDDFFFLTESIVSHKVPDYQLAALLMAIYLNGCSDEETYWLTEAMIASGQTIQLTPLRSFIVDKHSTGGVGDKTTLVLLPVLVACGLEICKLSGHGLGHTGGTLDKLSVFPGFRSKLALAEIKRIFAKSGMVIGGQTEDLVPADKIMYALRDVTGTVGSLPLIASSIMSKKLAGPAQGLVLDVKCGSGAHMKDLNHARNLAHLLTFIGKCHRIRTSALITNMQQPLGYAVGNSLEVQEAIDVLKGKNIPDLIALCIELGTVLLRMAHPDWDIPTCHERLRNSITNGVALDRLQKLVEQQGGKWREHFPPAKYKHAILNNKEGFVSTINALAVGECAMILGAGRLRKEDHIDLDAGVMLHKKCGDRVVPGEAIFTLYSNEQKLIEKGIEVVKNAFSITDEMVRRSEIILDRIVPF